MKIKTYIDERNRKHNNTYLLVECTFLIKTNIKILFLRQPRKSFKLSLWSSPILLSNRTNKRCLEAQDFIETRIHLESKAISYD